MTRPAERRTGALAPVNAPACPKSRRRPSYGFLAPLMGTFGLLVAVADVREGWDA